MHTFKSHLRVLCLILLTPSSAFLTTISDAIGETASNAHAPPLRGKTASVVVNQVGSGLFWSVNASVNGQNVAVMLDTGSSDLWLHGPRAPSPKGLSLGAPMMRSNGKDQYFGIQYDIRPDAQTSGPVVATHVKIGNFTIEDFGVGVATRVGFNYPLDGFLGLAFKGRNSVRPTQQPTLIEAAQDKLRRPLFSVSLKANALGTFSLGHIDRALYQGTLVSAPVNDSQASWVVDKLTLTAGRAKITQRMLFDTGAGDTMYADPTFVNNFWSQVGGSRNSTGTWTFPCNSTIPSMKISAGRTGSYFILGTTFNAGVVEGMTGVCRGALQGMGGYQTAGAPFFLTFFVVFDQAKPSISFAPQASYKPSSEIVYGSNCVDSGFMRCSVEQG